MSLRPVREIGRGILLIGSWSRVEKNVITHRLLDRDRTGWSQWKSVPFVQLSEARRNLGRFQPLHFLRFASECFHIEDVHVFMLEVDGYEFTDPGEHTLAPHCAIDRTETG